MTKSVVVKVPPNVVRAMEADLKNGQWQYEPLVVNFKSREEIENFYKTAVSVALAVKKEIIEKEGVGD